MCYFSYLYCFVSPEQNETEYRWKLASFAWILMHTHTLLLTFCILFSPRISTIYLFFVIHRTRLFSISTIIDSICEFVALHFASPPFILIFDFRSFDLTEFFFLIVSIFRRLLFPFWRLSSIFVWYNLNVFLFI